MTGEQTSRGATVPHEIRVPGPDDFEAFSRPVWRAFGDPAPEPDTLVDERTLWEVERSLGVVDGDEWVGGAGAFTMDVSLPGGAVVPAAGVTMVGVAATHRRRGILTALMARQLDDIAAGDEPIAMLTASESAIYGRFGYGVATRGVARTVATGHARLRDDAPTAPGRCRQVTVDEARRVLPAAFERVRATDGVAGRVRRWDAWWETHLFLDRGRQRAGASALYVLVHEDADGVVDGWAAFRVKEDWPDRLPAGTLVVVDLDAVDDAVRLDLYRVLLAHDLVAEVTTLHAPLDDVLVWSAADPRRLRTGNTSDWLWLRLLDVPSALADRRWGGAGGIVIEVVDRFRPASGGRFAIEADADGTGAVTRSTVAPALVLGAEELGALALGGVSASALARAGRVDELRPGALAAADALMRVPRDPFCATMF